MKFTFQISFKHLLINPIYNTASNKLTCTPPKKKHLKKLSTKCRILILSTPAPNNLKA